MSTTTEEAQVKDPGLKALHSVLHTKMNIQPIQISLFSFYAQYIYLHSTTTR